MKYFIFFVLLFSSCATGFKTKKLLTRDQGSAIYTIKKDQIPKNKYMDGKIIHPYKISTEKLSDILGNLKFSKTTKINTFNDYVFHKEQLFDSLEDLVQSMENIDDTQVLIVIKMYDHLKSVLSNFKRTTFYMWVDENGLNLVFSEIQEDVSKEKGINFYDWTQIEPINLEFLPDENRFFKDDNFTYKKVKGFNNKKWLIFSLDDLNKYKFKERENNIILKE
jgi:hypothetical protein